MERKISQEHEQQSAADIPDAAWETADSFDGLKSDGRIKQLWQERFANNPTSFFENENANYLGSLTPGDRVALLARASLHITVTPGSVQKHFERFPDDKLAIAAVISKEDGIAHDGVTHMLFCLVWPLVQDLVHGEQLRGFRRNDGKYDKIAARRELAPRFLLSNSKEDGGHLQREFGEAASGYIAAATRAYELAIAGNERLDVSLVFSGDAYRSLPADRKAAFLRECLGDMQYAFVFEETFNTEFTKERTDEWNARKKMDWIRSGSGVSHDSGHSMLFGTWQPSAAFDLDDHYFERKMNSTAARGGYIEEYAHERLLIAILNEFQNVRADADKNTDLLVEFWVKNKNPIFANAVVAALRAQNPERAGEGLLAMMRTDRGSKSAIAYVLRRVSGRITLRHVVEISELLRDEPGTERFFIESCAKASSAGELNPEEIEGSALAVIPGGSFKGMTRKYADEMLAIQARQYGSGGANYENTNPVLFNALQESLARRLHDPKSHSRFYVYTHANKVIGFFRFDDEREENGRLVRRHMASVMGDPDYKGGRLIETALQQALEKERIVPIYAECDPTKPITKKYLAMGFQVKGERDEKGLHVLDIELPARTPSL